MHSHHLDDFVHANRFDRLAHEMDLHVVHGHLERRVHRHLFHQQFHNFKSKSNHFKSYLTYRRSGVHNVHLEEALIPLVVAGQWPGHLGRSFNATIGNMKWLFYKF